MKTNAPLGGSQFDLCFYGGPCLFSGHAVGEFDYGKATAPGECVIPDQSDRQTINRVWYDELATGGSYTIGDCDRTAIAAVGQVVQSCSGEGALPVRIVVRSPNQNFR